eukprot:12893247-Prorocentrum_lima.AAC.1
MRIITIIITLTSTFVMGFTWLWWRRQRRLIRSCGAGCGTGVGANSRGGKPGAKFPEEGSGPPGATLPSV